MVLLHHYCQEYVESFDLAVFYGQYGGEWKQQRWAIHAVKRIEAHLGREAVEQMFEAAEQEWDAKNRRRLDPEDLALYENRHECPELFVERMLQRSDEHRNRRSRNADRVEKGEVESPSCDHSWEEQDEMYCSPSWMERCPKCDALRQREVR